MAVPDFQIIMLPLVQMIKDGREYSLTEMINHLKTEFKLTEDELLERIPSGRQAKFYNRVAWATTHLKKAQVIENTKRGVFKITPRGLEVLATVAGLLLGVEVFRLCADDLVVGVTGSSESSSGWGMSATTFHPLQTACLSAQR